jgi:hypothetical protein
MSTYMRRSRARSVRAESRGVRPESRGSCTRAGAVLPLPVRPRKSCVPSFAQKPTRVGRRLITREGVPFVEVGLQVVLPHPIHLMGRLQKRLMWPNSKHLKQPFVGPKSKEFLSSPIGSDDPRVTGQAAILCPDEGHKGQRERSERHLSSGGRPQNLIA